MKPIFKIKPNLFLKDNVVISFETEVAHIENQKLIEHGKYSRTTSRHIGVIASLLKVGVESSKEKMHGFYKYEMGVKIDLDFVLSNKASGFAVDYLRVGKSYFQVLCRLMDWDETKASDKEIIGKYLSTIGNADGIQLVRDFEKLF